MPEAGIGHLFMVGLPGTSLDKSTLDLVRTQRINNFILFARNVESPDQLRSLTSSLRQACRNEGLAPPLISIDQEGGSVSRLPAPFTQFPDARLLAGADDPAGELDNFAAICARELTGIGVNFNLAPVLDVCEEEQGLFMERRSLGSDPARVAELGRFVIIAMQKRGLAACAKHFPGLGAAVIDPHHTLPEVHRQADLLLGRDMLPFRAAAAAGVAAIMTSHTVYHALDSENPATLSEKILTGLLRTAIGYNGIIITDDLEMGAIENEQPLERAALTAFTAGADLLLICHDHDKVKKAGAVLLAAVQKGDISAQRVAASVGRVAAVGRRFAGEA